LLAAALDGTQRPFPPGRVVARLQRVVERAVGFDVGIEQIVLRRQKRVRPARRGDQRHPPLALLDDPCAGRTEVETPPRSRRGGIEFGLRRKLAQTAYPG